MCTRPLTLTPLTLSPLRGLRGARANSFNGSQVIDLVVQFVGIRQPRPSPGGPRRTGRGRKMRTLVREIRSPRPAKRGEG